MANTFGYVFLKNGKVGFYCNHGSFHLFDKEKGLFDCQNLLALANHESCDDCCCDDDFEEYQKKVYLYFGWDKYYGQKEE